MLPTFQYILDLASAVDRKDTVAMYRCCELLASTIGPKAALDLMFQLHKERERASQYEVAEAYAGASRPER